MDSGITFINCLNCHGKGEVVNYDLSLKKSYLRPCHLCEGLKEHVLKKGIDGAIKIIYTEKEVKFHMTEELKNYIDGAKAEILERIDALDLRIESMLSQHFTQAQSDSTAHFEGVISFIQQECDKLNNLVSEKQNETLHHINHRIDETNGNIDRTRSELSDQAIRIGDEIKAMIVGGE